MAVCSDCIEMMPILGPACHHCAHPLPDAQVLICGHCIKRKPHFDRSIIRYIFEEPLRNLLHQFKYHNGLYLGSFLSHLMLQALPSTANLPECLIPVPMHSQRIKLRGFNQAAILAKSLARKLKITCDVTSCQKVLNTEPQASLDREQRKNNLRHAFQSKKLSYCHVAIVDDLLTTGSTAHELAGTLKQAGVLKVDVWSCARAVSTSTQLQR